MWNYTQSIPSGVNLVPVYAEGAWAGASWDGILNVGMHLFSVGNREKMSWPSYRLEEPNVEWPIKANNEMSYIRSMLDCDDWFLDIVHIGSTSIPGMPAKPILDMMVKVDTDMLGDKKQVILKRFKDLGYYQNSNNPSYLSKYSMSGSLEFSIWLILSGAGDGIWESRILFRDYLIQHQDIALEYAQLKRSLINQRLPFSYYVNKKGLIFKRVFEYLGYDVDYMLNNLIIHENIAYPGVHMPETKRLSVSLNGGVS